MTASRMNIHSRLRYTLALVLTATVLVTAVPYQEYILAPTSRTLYPVSVRAVNGTVLNAGGLAHGQGGTTLTGKSAFTLDFGKNIAGLVSFNVLSLSTASDYIGFTFSESSMWISEELCDSTTGADEPLWFPVTHDGLYSAPEQMQRGGFRYLSVIHNTTGTIQIDKLSVHFTAIPHVADDALREYTGYFHADDNKLNRVWYAGVYTTQLCTIDSNAGNSVVRINSTLDQINVSGTNRTRWYSNDTIANGSSVLVDGAKRDRLVWPGDMVVAVPSVFVSTNDMDPVKNALDSLFALQNLSGELPYAGVPFSQLNLFSFTYHLYTLLGLNDYYLFTGDKDYLSKNWPRFKKGLNYTLSFVDDSGLMNVTSAYDWGRFGMGGHNIEANAVLYYTLNVGAKLAETVGDIFIISCWQQYASMIKEAANARLWDASAGLYRDNETTMLYPQDGNSWAVVSNITANSTQIALISAKLASRWTKVGAPAPETHNTVSPFISSLELQAHYIADQPERAMNLMRRMWADFMLDDPRMTNSSFIEGYQSDGTLHYVPYDLDSRISHAHGWASGPTSALTFFAAGLGIVGPQGKTWALKPSPGSLGSVEAGFTTGLGSFAAKYKANDDGWTYSFQTPRGTNGTLSIASPKSKGILKIFDTDNGVETRKLHLKGVPSSDEASLQTRVLIEGLEGGNFTATFSQS